MSEMDRARRLFESFHNKQHDPLKIVEISGGSGTAIAVGRLIGLSYRPVSGTKEYYHDFAVPLPRLFVSADGRQIFVEGGGYRFSDRGFLK
jgi:hypothetical protein